MEEHGIGTDATIAEHIQKQLERWGGGGKGGGRREGVVPEGRVRWGAKEEGGNRIEGLVGKIRTLRGEGGGVRVQSP